VLPAVAQGRRGIPPGIRVDDVRAAYSRRTRLTRLDRGRAHEGTARDLHRRLHRAYGMRCFLPSRVGDQSAPESQPRTRRAEDGETTISVQQKRRSGRMGW